MQTLLENVRRTDISFSQNGRIRISANVARLLGLENGQSINIGFDNGECLLFANKHSNAYGRYIGQCYRSKGKGMHFYANSVALCRAMLRKCGITAPKASFFVGEAFNDNGKTYIPIIYKNPILL